MAPFTIYEETRSKRGYRTPGFDIGLFTMRRLFLSVGFSVILSGCSLFGGQEATSQSLAPTPTVVPIPTVEPRAAPHTLFIPLLEVMATVEWVGLAADRRMDVPNDWWNVGWYELGVKPGEVGNAVMAGHLDSPTGPAVFASLGSLAPGDEVVVVDVADNQLTFEVVRVVRYKDAAFPIADVFGPANEAWLQLITCEGTFDQVTQNYSDRLVVSARLVE
jgi:hypothetical protein